MARKGSYVYYRWYPSKVKAFESATRNGAYFQSARSFGFKTGYVAWKKGPVRGWTRVLTKRTR